MKKLLVTQLLYLCALCAMAQDSAYMRRFVEEGKRWQVVRTSYENEPLELLLYYLSGDTLINGQPGCQMYCEHITVKIDSDTPASLWSEYVGALYEEDCRVYFYDPTAKHKDWTLLYDFAASVGDTLELYAGPALVFAEQYYGKPTVSCVVTNKATWDTDPNCKGTVTSVVVQRLSMGGGEPGEEGAEYERIACEWIEGVGSRWIPVHNLLPYNWGGYSYTLVSCYVDGELLYYNQAFSEKVPPFGWLGDATTSFDSAKKRIDFTHVVKKEPKAPGRRTRAADEGGISGEFDSESMIIDFGSLSDAYTVSIKDKNGQTMYQKKVYTDSVLALEIHISMYKMGDYTVCVENDNESFVGSFNPAEAASIVGLRHSAPDAAVCYDLMGRRLHAKPAAGFYISNGKKYWAR